LKRYHDFYIWTPAFAGVTAMDEDESVLPAEAGIQKKKDWIPGQARNDSAVKALCNITLE
jgi:hypothetical protein